MQVQLKNNTDINGELKLLSIETYSFCFKTIFKIITYNKIIVDI